MMARTMRALALAATVGAVAAMAVAAPAYARVVDEEATLSTSGGVSVAWHGDRARGCAQAGLCGYRGSLTVHPTTEGQLFLELAHGRPRSVFGELDPDQGTVARVQRR